MTPDDAVKVAEAIRNNTNPTPDGPVGMILAAILVLNEQREHLSARCERVEGAVRDFVDVIDTADRQRQVKSGWGATMPKEALAYVQPSAFAELLRFARRFKAALDSTEPGGVEK
jgi:hypothetical protein